MPSQRQSLISRIATTIPKPLRAMLALLTGLLTLRNVLLLFCLLNIKNLPLAWEVRLMYRSYRAWLSKRDVARVLQESAASSPTTISTTSTKLPGSSHPLFAPLTISTRTPFLEIDHNLHKSNSTYFSDLDESRTALMVHFLSSTKFSPQELDKEGFKGPFAVILGAVHASFLKEIKPYEKYSVRSRVVGWDGKWILIGSVFVRTKTKKDRIKEQKDIRRKAELLGKSEDEIRKELGEDHTDEILLASCLSKYVVKKGRYTVPPERCFKSAGWLPEKPAGQASPPAGVLDTSAAPTPDTEPILGEIKITEEDLRRKAQETAAKAAGKLQKVEHVDSQIIKPSKADEACLEAASKWSWDDIEAERSRGMKLAEHWFSLDKQLKDLWAEDFTRGIVR